MPPAMDSDPSTSSAQSTVALPQQPGVSITKALSAETMNLGVDQTIVDAGDTLTYTLSVENVGNTWLSAVTVLDPYLGEITCTPDLSASDARFVVGAGTVVCTASVSVDQAMVNAGFFESVSTVSGQFGVGGVTAHMGISLYVKSLPVLVCCVVWCSACCR